MLTNHEALGLANSFLLFSRCVQVEIEEGSDEVKEAVGPDFIPFLTADSSSH